MVTSKATSNFTMLQVEIGLLVQEKRLIQQLYQYGVTSSYDEVRRFKISAAASLTQDEVPDYSGLNTKHSRKTGQSKKPKTEIRYRPLINKTPTDPSTIVTAMIDVEAISQTAGQIYSVFTCDQQLYRITLDIIWENPERWRNFYPRIGGIHWAMSFIGCIGKLMANSGLEKLMSSAFAGVNKMLLGKRFPMNVRVLRFVVLELLRGFVEEMYKYDDLLVLLDAVSEKSRLAKHCVDNLIRPVLLIMLYIRAEREGEFALHLYVCNQMLPYFFAARHWNYARDGVAYVRMMGKLPDVLLDKFMRGEHVIHLKQGIWNGIWSDMGIETTYMKIGKGPSGLIGVTTNTRSATIWANGHHLCGEVLTDLKGLRDGNQNKGAAHKEEGKGRMKSDQADRDKLRTTLASCIHPLKVDVHDPIKLVNIYTGEEECEKSNVERLIEIGKNQLADFQNNLPEGFRERLSSKVITMTEGKKTKKAVDKPSFNTDLIFSRVLYLLGVHQLDLSTRFDYELAPVPTSFFKDTGEARYTSSKAVLKNKLKVEISSRGLKPDAVIVDGGGMLHSSIHWPKEGLVEDLVSGIIQYVSKIVASSDGYVVFDRYFDYSIKSDTRQKRIGVFQRLHTLSLETPLPATEICMSSAKTKENLIEIIATVLLDRFTEKNFKQKLVVTSKSIFPEVTSEGTRIKRTDLKTLFDEADYIIPQQVESAI